MTSMAHDLHFLERLSRVESDHVELALALYHDVPLVRHLLETHPLPDSAARVALSLDDPALGPFVIVTREGDFVTCLGPGMSPAPHPVIPRAHLDRTSRELTRVRDALTRAMAHAEVRGGMNRLVKRVVKAGDRLSREDFTALIGFQPLIRAALHLALHAASTRAADARKPLLHATRRSARGLDPAHLRRYWQDVWAIGHLITLVALDGADTLTALPLPQEDLPNPDLFSWSASNHGVTAVLLRGAWAVARVGKPLLGPYKAGLHTELFRETTLQYGFGLAAMGIRHAKYQAEIVKVLSRQHVRATSPAGAEAFKLRLQTLSDMVAASHVLPPGVDARLAAFTLCQYATQRTSAPTPSPDDPAEIELDLLTRLHDPADVRLDTLAFVDACRLLLWVARAAPEDLYVPAAHLNLVAPPWTPERTLDLLDAERRRSVRKVTPRTSTKIGRNAPCPCNSGRKHKLCCGA